MFMNGLFLSLSEQTEFHKITSSTSTMMSHPTEAGFSFVMYIQARLSPRECDFREHNFRWRLMGQYSSVGILHENLFICLKRIPS